tara:strand:+ start:800 stop:1525 length:726 start_codon:yes stop_codon:yes gene_type:complete
MKVVSWFSAGCTSAVATHLAIKKYGLENVEIIFFETGNHHPDNGRFIKECEELFGKKIQIVQNEKYENIYDVFRKQQFINSPYGAPCTVKLKKDMRLLWESNNTWDIQIMGFEAGKREEKRAKRFLKEYPKTNATFPLIEANMTKEDAVIYLSDYNIELPVMYKLGYSNNNCIGCVKGGMGYWNKIRVDFPEVFDYMAELEREIGASCMSSTYLDELDPQRGYSVKPVVVECGIFCEENWL